MFNEEWIDQAATTLRPAACRRTILAVLIAGCAALQACKTKTILLYEGELKPEEECAFIKMEEQKLTFSHSAPGEFGPCRLLSRPALQWGGKYYGPAATHRYQRLALRPGKNSFDVRVEFAHVYQTGSSLARGCCMDAGGCLFSAVLQTPVTGGASYSVVDAATFESDRPAEFFVEAGKHYKMKASITGLPPARVRLELEEVAQEGKPASPPTVVVPVGQWLR